MEEKVTKKPQSHEKTKRLKPVPPPPAQGSKPSRGSPQFAFRIHDDIHEMEAMAKPLVQDIKHLDSLVVPAKDLNMRASYTLALNRSKEKKNSITLDYFKQGNIKPLPVITPAHDSREESMARLEGKLREIEKEVANSKMLDLGIHGKTVKAKLVTDLPPVKDPVPSRIIMSQNAQSKSSAVTHQQTSPALGSQGLKGKKHLPVERRQLGKDEFGGEHPPRNKSCISPNNLSQQHNNISHSEEDNNLPMEASIKNPTNVNGKTKGENYSSKEQLNEPNADKPADIEIETHLENLWNISTGSNFQTSIIGEYQRSRNTRLWGSLQNIKKSSTNEVPRFSLEGTPSPSGFRKLSRVTEVPRLSLEGRPPSPLFFRKSSLVHQSLVGQSPSPLCTRKSSTVSGKLKERKADLNLLGQGNNYIHQLCAPIAQKMVSSLALYHSIQQNVQYGVF